MYLFTHGRRGKQCKIAAHFLDLILPCSDVHHIVPPRTFKHDHFKPRKFCGTQSFPWLSSELGYSQKTKGWLGTSIFGHIQPDGMRPIGTIGASDVLGREFSIAGDGQQNVEGINVVCCMGVSLNGGTQQPGFFLLKMIILGCFGGTTI